MPTIQNLMHPSARVLRACAIGFLICAASAPNAQTANERRYAFVVTNQNYAPELNPLKFTHSDGDNVSAALQQLGFSVRLLRDASRSEFDGEFRAFISDLKGSGPETVAFFYFSGHSFPNEANTSNYLIFNERIPAVGIYRGLDRIGAPLRSATQSIRPLNIKASFVVIDSHLDAVEPALLEGFNQAGRGMILTARGRPGLQAADTNDFSRALAEALLTPGLDAQAVFKQVQLQLTELTHGKQVPYIEDRLFAKYYFQLRNAASPGESSSQNATAGLGRRVALVIGNSRYQYSGVLTNPENDARAVARALHGLGFAEVQAHYNIDRQAFVAALRKFQEAAATADWAVVYYAGHGMEIGGRNYLLPVDSKLDKLEDVEDETVPVSRLFERLADFKGVKIVILDACRDNPLASRSFRANKRNINVSKGLAMMDAVAGTLIALAADPGMPAFDGEGEHSPYASALLQHIGDPGVDVRLMFSRVYETLHEQMKGKQESWIQVKLPGRELFFRPR